MAETRFTPDAAATMRRAIAEVGGDEVFAVGSLDESGKVATLEVVARGTEDAVLALRTRPRAGQVVIHNHPSGVLRPSEADTQIAGDFGENGVGFVIVNNAVNDARWVVEPHKKKQVPVDPDEVRRVFTELLPAAFAGWEPRPGQIDMALRVAATLSEGGVTVLEAGTGTGKSLAYLVPAALWAKSNDSRVVVSTYTRTLQGQLVADDLPALVKVVPVKFAVLKGRNNYLCKRKLELAGDEDKIDAIRKWAATSATGDFAELGFDVDEDTWEQVESDTDQTLRARCPHFNTCFYYQARRTAAGAHVIVANHALLLSDLSLKKASNTGILPDFDRVVLDEAHHLEQAATQVGACRLSTYSLARTIGPLLGRRERLGALERISRRWPEVAKLAQDTRDVVTEVRDTAGFWFEGRSPDVKVPVRITGPLPEPDDFSDLGQQIERAAARIGAMQAALESADIKPEDAQPVLDLGRARRRLEEAATVAREMLAEDPQRVRWLEPGGRGVVAQHAPLDIGAFVHQHLSEDRHSTVLTSATLAVNGSAEHWMSRVGLPDAEFVAFPSPFHYREQAILALPKDLPRPDDPTWNDVAGDFLVQALQASRGGAFVLCTSYAAVEELGGRVERAMGGAHAILRQGRGAKGRLLDHFRKDRGAILFGTDSFWEGVSVRGDGLRQVIIPRLPFRVPTEPVSQARHERMVADGLDPFRAWSLPEAVLKLRQGFGRLIRSGTDRGAVVVMDRRLHEMWYGRVFLASLPDATRVVGPSRMVIERLRAFYSGW